MKIDIHQSKDLFIEHGKRIEEVLRQAVQQALAEHQRAHNRVASWADERVVLIEPGNITIDLLTGEGQI
jgi:ERCC4-related helicase